MMFLSYVSLNIKSYLYSEAIQTLIIYLKSSDSYFPFVKVVRPHSAKSVTKLISVFQKYVLNGATNSSSYALELGFFILQVFIFQ